MGVGVGSDWSRGQMGGGFGPDGSRDQMGEEVPIWYPSTLSVTSFPFQVPHQLSGTPSQIGYPFINESPK